MTTNPSDVGARLRKPDPYIALPDEDRVKWQYPTEALRLEAADLIDSQAKLLAEREWRLIDETTPRNQELLLGAYYDSGTWDQVLGRWVIWRKNWPPVGQQFPTHWMYPPSPPKLSEPT